MTQDQEIILTFQSYGNQMTLHQMHEYSWYGEFRARKAEINKDESNEYALRLARRDPKPSNNLYILERKPKEGFLL